MVHVIRNDLTTRQIMDYQQWLIDMFQKVQVYDGKEFKVFTDPVVMAEYEWCQTVLNERRDEFERQTLLDDWYWAFEEGKEVNKK